MPHRSAGEAPHLQEHATGDQPMGRCRAPRSLSRPYPMRLPIAVTLLAVTLLAATAAAQTADYVVLAAFAASDPFDAPAQTLARHRQATLLRFDPQHLDPVRAALREAKPKNVALVLRPDQLDFPFARRFLQLATEIDDDPFVDFAFGYITGRTAADAEALVTAGVRRQPEAVERVASVAGGAERSQSSTMPHGLRRTGIPGLQLWSAGAERFPEQGRDREFLARNLGKIAGADAVTFIGHGMPNEVVGGPTPAELKDLKLTDAVVLNVACYTGVTERWFEEDYQHGLWRQRTVAAEDSFCLALLRTGVVGYTAYVCPRPAGPELDTDLAALLASGASLGEARRRDYDKTVLGYLGFGHERLVLAAIQDGDKLAPGRDAVHDIMLEGATGGVLFGDPAVVPFVPRPADELVAIEVETIGDGLRVDVEVPAAALFLQCNDPTARFDGQMAMKVHARVPLGDRHVRDVVVDSLQVGRARLPHRVLWAIEEDQGQRFVQLKVNFARSERLRGNLALTARVLTTADAAAGQRRGGQVLRPPPPPADVKVRAITDAMRERAAARRVSAAALQAAIDATAHGLGDADAPADAVPRLAGFGREGFQALCVLLEVGHTHGGSWRLFRETWQPGDERELLALASGDPLPNWAQWTAIEALGIADTPEVRNWVRDRLSAETDAGLWMSLANAAAHLGAREHAKAIGARVLEFREDWSGVEPYLLASLAELGGDDAIAALEAIAAHAEAKTWQQALQYLDRLAPEAAARARAARK
ncbi:MAG: hypothetical protein IPK26_13705 [Planctomycetes bacterium]|nr:hypothetical protein [Planctomycetota bacterium]